MRKKVTLLFSALYSETFREHRFLTHTMWCASYLTTCSHCKRTSVDVVDEKNIYNNIVLFLELAMKS